jgi:uncharacterized membrane protein YkvA (DUF1232 family)
LPPSLPPFSDEALEPEVASREAEQPLRARTVTSPVRNPVSSAEAVRRRGTVIIVERVSRCPIRADPGRTGEGQLSCSEDERPRRTIGRNPADGDAAMDDHTTLLIILGFIAVILLIGVVLLAIALYVIYRYRVPLRGIAAMAGALIYFVSPVDVLPEAVLGPLGLVDDIGVVGAVGMFVYRLVQARRAAVTGTATPSDDVPRQRH